MHWIIGENSYGEAGIEDLLEVLKRAGISHSEHKIVPFVWDLVPDIALEGPVMLIGSYAVRRVAEKKGWTPGVFDLGDLTYADHVARWGDHMLNADAVYCTFADVPGRLPPGTDEFFIRPVTDAKFFTGKVIDRVAFDDWHRKVVVLKEDDGTGLRSDTEVMVSTPRNILRE